MNCPYCGALSGSIKKYTGGVDAIYDAEDFQCGLPAKEFETGQPCRQKFRMFYVGNFRWTGMTGEKKKDNLHIQEEK